jgi:hypothetical protein
MLRCPEGKANTRSPMQVSKQTYQGLAEVLNCNRETAGLIMPVFFFGDSLDRNHRGSMAQRRPRLRVGIRVAMCFGEVGKHGIGM